MRERLLEHVPFAEIEGGVIEASKLVTAVDIKKKPRRGESCGAELFLGKRVLPINKSFLASLLADAEVLRIVVEHETACRSSLAGRGPKAIGTRRGCDWIVTSPPHLFPICDVGFCLTMEGSFRRGAEAPFVFFGVDYGTLNPARRTRF